MDIWNKQMEELKKTTKTYTIFVAILVVNNINEFIYAYFKWNSN